MGSFARGEIVLYPFPYTDLQRRKLRPCLVLSDNMGEDILLCQITSQQTRKDKYAIELKHKGLNIDSYIRANMLFTASKRQIRKKICKINDTTYCDVVDVIARIISK